MTEPKRRQDGSIDFDFYRAEAARERKDVRDHVVWGVVLPSLWSAPGRLLAATRCILLHRSNELGQGSRAPLKPTVRRATSVT